MPTKPMSQAKMQQAVRLVREHGNVAKAAQASGINRLTLSGRYRAAMTLEVESTIAKFPLEIVKKKFLITCAQNATPVNVPFFKALQVYARERDAQIIVVPIRYKNPTSRIVSSRDGTEIWDESLLPYLCDQRVHLCDNLVLLADIKTVPTAEQPLSGFDSFTHAESGIIGHPRLALKTVAVPRNSLPKIMTTTGAVTVRNYTDTKLGKKGEFHHTAGAALVELDGEHFHLRQINACSDGSFIDLDREYTTRGSRAAGRALALVMGDTHVDSIDPDVQAATWGADGVLAALRPRSLVWHDLLDGYSRNPHHAKNPFFEIAKIKAGQRNDVAQEIYRALDFVKTNTPAGVKSIIVPSNHNDFVYRYIVNTDWREDAQNAEFYLTTALAMTKSAKLGDSGTQTIDPLSYWGERLLPGVLFLKRDESCEIGGIECGFHGDRGPNGSRGSLRAFRNIGPKTITGHSHTPGIDQGSYAGGTSTRLRLEYNSGPSSWLQTHVVIYANGKRALLNFIKGKWRA